MNEEKKGEVKQFSAKCRTFAAVRRESKLRKEIEEQVRKEMQEKKDD